MFTKCAFVFVISSLFSSLTFASTTEGCADIPGVEVLFKRTSTRVIWVGEGHGTVEMPAMFGDLVCIASTKGKRVVVALERSQSDQVLWDSYMDSDGSKAAMEKLLNGVDSKSQDGRSSVAMFALAERLRQYKHQGRILGVQLIIEPFKAGADPARFAADHEAGMAHAVMEILSKQPNVLVMAYSGNVHAMKTMAFYDKTVPLAASLIPTDELVALNLLGGPGEAWSCYQKDKCGPNPNQGSDHPRGIVLSSATTDTESKFFAKDFDAFGYTGTKTTASPPAVLKQETAPSEPISKLVAED